MHELSLVAALVDQIEEVAKQQSFSRVLKIRLAVGGLSGVEPECLVFCFSEGVRGSVLEGAELTIETVNVRVQCQICKKESICESPELLVCSFCFSPRTWVKAGKDFRVIDLEVNENV